ncbi:ATP-binding protein [Planoprotostelium fungivorum]|uniref:ATP-binding protein n=1 Tax=Planoprotostelium fungivorum TaxID=1890364 RepID=A0A2P6P074_9EUKA|nr:ATP-binding protein [Planoprotostelium fungivorum]
MEGTLLKTSNLDTPGFITPNITVTSTSDDSEWSDSNNSVSDVHTDKDYEVTELISQNNNSSIYRGYNTTSGTSVIIKVPREANKKILHKYSKEYEFGKKMADVPYVMQYLSMRKYRRSLALIMEDFHGVSLQKLLSQEILGLTEALKIGIEMAEGIGQIHQRGVIHLALSPIHVMVNRNTSITKIIDFSSASVLNRLTAVLKSSSPVQMEWMAPEQTGRMNKDVDYRTDYYSFGAILYRMITGCMPFVYPDFSKMMYALIAKTPEAPHKVNRSVPQSVSDIIIKLMSKNAEDRYQSTYGVKMDLQRCLTELLTGTISDFPPGQKDVKSTFQVVQKLYGRDKEIQTLLSSYERISQQEINSSLVLVAGYSGIGKTSLINEIHKPLSKSCGYFVSGKIDQFNCGVPYSSLVQAFKQLIKTALTESQEQVAYWKTNLLNVLNGRGQIMIDVIPDLELIIGPQPEVIKLAPKENSIRFKLTFVDFVSVFTKAQHPLVLFLDDLQWSDYGTLNLIEELLTNDHIKNLMIIGAYRDNEVGPGHQLNLVISNLAGKAEVVTIQLKTLALDHINHLIYDSLNTSPSRALSLSEIVTDKTKGNPFFVNVFLNNLVNEELLTFQSTMGQWMWEPDQIRARQITDNVVHMMTDRIKRLNVSTQQVLSIAAAIGNQFKLSILSYIAKKTLDEIVDAVWPAIQDELLVAQGEVTSVCFTNATLREEAPNLNMKFLHDRVQQAAYEMTPEEDRAKIHLEIGRKLVEITPPSELDDCLFDILGHFKIQLGSALLVEPEERLKMAHLWTQGTERAKMSNAVRVGAEYAAYAVGMLPPNHWDTLYDLSLRIFKLRTECEYLCGNTEFAASLYPIMLSKCKSLKDKTSVYWIKILQLEAQQKYAESIVACVECVDMHGVQLLRPDAPDDVVMKELAYQLDQLKINMNGRSVADLYNAPDMEDEGQQSVLAIMSTVWTSTFCVSRKYYMATISTIVLNYTLKYGISKFSSRVFCNWSMSAADMDIDYKFAHDMGVLGCSLLETHPNEAIRYHCYFSFSIGICNKVMPLSHSFTLIDRAFESSQEHGDIPYTCYSAHHMITLRYYKSVKLTELHKMLRSNWTYLNKHNPFIYNYGTGATLAMKWHLKSDVMGEEEFMNRPISGAINYSAYYASLLQIEMWRDGEDPMEQMRLIDLSIQYTLEGCTGFYAEVETQFCIGIVIMRLYQNKDVIPADKVEVYENLLQHSVRFMKKESENCPSNNEHKYLLLQAQKAKLEGRHMEAVVLYNQARESARSHQFTQYEALCNELVSKLWHSLNQPNYAKTHLEDALYLYHEWGSIVKEEQLLSRFSVYLSEAERNILDTRISLGLLKNPMHVLSKASASSLSPIVKNRMDVMDVDSASVSSTEMDSASVDVQIMAKVSQATSMDMSLEQYLDSMMKLIIESVGAHKGIFLLAESGGELLVVAEGDIDKTEVDLRAVSLSSMVSYPHTVINYVARTKETVIVGDVKKKSDFSFETSHYMQNSQVKSLMCAPILKNNKFKGVIYLENNLTNDAFTDQRAKIVNVIAVQMALQMDNAKFSQLLESERRYRSLATELEVVKNGLEEFIDVLCHELRNPLNGIYGSKQLMASQLQTLKETLQPYLQALPAADVSACLSDLEDMLGAVSISADHLKDIVDTVLTVSMLENSAIKLRNIVFKPMQVVDKVALMYKAKLLEKGLTFTVDVPSEDVVCIGDPYRLTQVLINIVSNSIKFMDKGGITIRYRSAVEGDKIRLDFTVKDTGIGLSEQEIARLFQPFTQANSNIYTKYGGSGLGLKISKEIIELMDGRIYLESQKESIGVGTDCHFHITCAPASKAESSPNIVTASRKRLNTSREALQTEAMKRAKTQHQQRRHILIVEDNVINQKLMKKILETDGYMTDLADNGREAFEKVRNAYGSGQAYDAILMDFEMPIMNGIEATQKIRQFEVENNMSPVPIIGVSANARDTHAQTAQGIGMNCYITKPFQKKDIFDAIERWNNHQTGSNPISPAPMEMTSQSVDSKT